MRKITQIRHEIFLRLYWIISIRNQRSVSYPAECQRSSKQEYGTLLSINTGSNDRIPLYTWLSSPPQRSALFDLAIVVSNTLTLL